MPLLEDNLSCLPSLERIFRVAPVNKLPIAKIEKKLRSIPEYQDVFNPTTGHVEIVEVIPDGNFRHIINCLKIVFDFQQKGIFENFCLERAVVVQSLLLHDIGKRQPVLQVGDIVDPKTVFPAGKKHARISAGIVGSYPLVSTDVISLIYYHHHNEEELPADFPESLKPMWRLVRLIDGLSAALTRRHAQLDILVQGSRVVVFENNIHPYYNGVREIDLLSGKSCFKA
jgi:hypothetical protein